MGTGAGGQVGREAGELGGLESGSRQGHVCMFHLSCAGQERELSEGRQGKLRKCERHQRDD